MRKTISLLLLLLMTAPFAWSQGFFTKANTFLKTHVTGGGLVDYAGIKESPAELNELVDMIESYSLSGSSASKKAFWLNAYNILVIKNVINHYPIAKPLDVDGFFDKIKFKVAGSSLTLSDIENKKIRPTYKDARVHFALVCAAKSCPPIANYAFTPSNVEAKLDALTRVAINNPYWTKVNSSARTVKLSKIFEWYKEDFVAGGKTIMQFVNKYRNKPIPSDYKQTFYTYNWSLNVKK